MKFTTATIISVTDGRLLCPMDDVYAILNHMTGESLFTHELPGAMEKCAPFILAQHPGICSMMPPKDAEVNWPQWIKANKEALAVERDVEPLPADALGEREHPITSLARMMGGKTTP